MQPRDQHPELAFAPGFGQRGVTNVILHVDVVNFLNDRKHVFQRGLADA